MCLYCASCHHLSPLLSLYMNWFYSATALSETAARRNQLIRVCCAVYLLKDMAEPADQYHAHADSLTDAQSAAAGYHPHNSLAAAASWLAIIESRRSEEHTSELQSR